MLENKVIVEDLPTEGDDSLERRIFSNKGEMAQILNRTAETFRLLVYWDLDTITSNQERGQHCHQKKTELFYVLTGEMELSLEDLEDAASKKLIVRAGNRITIRPRVAHAFRSLAYSQVLEYSPDPYDPSDTVPHRIVG